jgi:hypothetical protein
VAVQKAQAAMLIDRLHYALSGWDGAEGRRDAQECFYESAQAREFAGLVEFAHLDFDGAGSIEPRGAPPSTKGGLDLGGRTALPPWPRYTYIYMKAGGVKKRMKVP